MVQNTEYTKYIKKTKILFRYFGFLQYISENCRDDSYSKIVYYYCNNQLKYDVKLKIVRYLIEKGYLKPYKKDTYKGNKPTFVSKTQSGVVFFHQEEERFKKLKCLIDVITSDLNNFKGVINEEILQGS